MSIHHPPDQTSLPHALLYATSAGLGGSGLDATSIEGALASWRSGFLKKAICYPVRQEEIPRRLIQSLQHHPVRLMSGLGSVDYYSAKKRYLDWMAAQSIRRGSFDFFHGWSGDSFKSLVEARLKEIPSVIDIPTWHRNKGIAKSPETLSERKARQADRGWRDWRKKLTIIRQQHLLEYDLATVILVPSQKSRDTFLAAGIPDHKLHYVGRGVDVQKYRPADSSPDIFRVVFTGALIKRKGVHHLLAAWKKLNLKNAELVLLGTVHDEIKPALHAAAGDSVKVPGFCSSVQDELRKSAVFVFPSECEGFAKATIEAAACGLPIIGTMESGDMVVDRQTGLKIHANQAGELAAALEYASQHRDEMAAMGRNARQMAEEQFTWDHYRARVLQGYARAQRIMGV